MQNTLKDINIPDSKLFEIYKDCLYDGGGVSMLNKEVKFKESDINNAINQIQINKTAFHCESDMRKALELALYLMRKEVE